MPRVCTLLWKEVYHQHGIWLSEERTAMEVTAIRQRLEHGFIHTGWVNSDRQMADGLTKPQAAWKLLEIMSAERLTIVWDATFQPQTDAGADEPAPSETPLP